MQNGRAAERFETLVVGGGQAGLSVGYHLRRLGRTFLILEANERVGDSWRNRWDSLRLFTPSRYNGLDGMPFPGPDFAFPTKDEMADYLEAYRSRFGLPVRTGVRVERVSRQNGRFLVETTKGSFEAQNVVVAMANFQRPKVPGFAGEIRSNVVQLHSKDYKGPEQLAQGDVLVVGAGNSGAEIAAEVSKSHRTWLSGRDVGEIPFRVSGANSRLFLSWLVFRVLFHRVLSVSTPLGRKVRSKILHAGGPLIRTKWRHLSAAGVGRVPRVEGTREGLPLLADQRTLDVANIIWCTGFRPGFSWIDLPIFDEHGEPRHQRGEVPDVPGLYFVGLHFLNALSSTMIHGVGRDAQRIARVIASRSGERQVASPHARRALRVAAL